MASFIASTVLRVVDRANAIGENDWCATLELRDDPARWLQVTPDQLNVAYPYTDEPMNRLRTCGVLMPVQITIAGWEANKYVTFDCDGADVQLVGDFAARVTICLLAAKDAANVFTVKDELL